MEIFFWLLLVVAAIIWATAKLQLHPFLALLTGGIGIGFLAGLESTVLITSLSEGFGNTLQSIGIVIAAGAVIGEYLDRSGGARVMAERILARIGEKNSPLAMSLTGYIVSIPVFCDSGFIVLSSLNKAISRRTSVPLVVLAIALATGLYTTHVFVPPTPGPLAAAATLGADVGRVLILGLIVSVPVMLTALLWATLYGRRFSVEADPVSPDSSVIYPLPSFKAAIAPILLPILLIAFKSVAEYPTSPFGEGWVLQALSFAGHPVIALLAGVGLSFLMVRGPGTRRVNHEWIEEALKKAGVVILITGAGGAFGNVLRETDLGEFAGQIATVHQWGILIPFLIAAFLKTAQGSSTVAIITAAAISAPLLEPLGLAGETGKAIAVLAIGAGAMTVSHVNDSYFWVISKFSNMDLQTALKTHTPATLLMGITALITLQGMLWILN